MNPIASLLGAANVKNLITHPYVSPLFGDFHDFPPLLIQCGDAECLRDEGTLLAHKASLAGVQVYHEVYEDCPHVFQAMFFLEASKKAFRSHRNFVRRVLPSSASINNSSSMTASSTDGGDAAQVHSKGMRDMRVDLSEMDQEVMSDAHNIKADGQAEVASLPASPRALRRELSSLTPLPQTSNTSTNTSTAALGNTTSTVTGITESGGSTPPDALDAQAEFLEEEDDLDYDDEEDEEDDQNPFNVESSGASATASELDASSTMDDNDFEQLPVSSSSTSDVLHGQDGNLMAEDPQYNPIADLALNATAGMVKLGTIMSNSTHHDLDSVAEEQDESIAKMEIEEKDENIHDDKNSSFSFPRNTSSHRLHSNYHHPHSYHQYTHNTNTQNNQQYRNATTSNLSTPSHSPSASFTSLPHSSPSGSHTPLASRTPTSSAPPSPGTSIRNSNRQRSFSSLSMASLTPSISSKQHSSAQVLGSPNASTSSSTVRPGHSRSNSSISTRTIRAGQFREMSKPRARANSHPDLQALLDSYDAAGPAQHTVVWRSDEDNMQEGHGGDNVDYAQRDDGLSNDNESIDDDTFDA